MKENKSNEERRELEGSELTEELMEDMYTAGTSDGIHQLQDGKIKVENEPFKK
ncbi:hypothetical protein [Paenibacillus sp. 1P07SE]|uniref:hypothetical protein n=1 Tax=Paenibacillus sp. 1P07SE TaxID=3132209 RepID=UPI0039A40A5B